MNQTLKKKEGKKVTNNEISQVLGIVLGVMIFILFVLLAIFVFLKLKSGSSNKKTNNDMIISDRKSNEKKDKEKAQSISNMYTKKSIMDFMEFDKIEDNMIVQKKGRRFLMVVECQGINYDLMSQPEKIAVEEGFQQFLNTLRHPIQIYIQTRTINLGKSIDGYKSKVKLVEDKYNQMLLRYNQMQSSETYNQNDLDREFYELTKQKNLLEYGKDLINNTEKMSLNKNILNKNYYIIVPYFPEESEDSHYDYEEVKNMAFSELYTKSQSIIRTLTASSITGKILSSEELVELLYVAYNRDESETFGIEKAIRAGYDELYSTAPDVYEKKIKALDEIINQRAIELANEKIEKVKSRPHQIAEERENSMEELVRKMAQMVLDQNREYIGGDVAQEAIKEIQKEEKGENADEKVKEKTTRGRKRKTV